MGFPERARCILGALVAAASFGLLTWARLPADWAVEGAPLLACPSGSCPALAEERTGRTARAWRVWPLSIPQCQLNRFDAPPNARGACYLTRSPSKPVRALLSASNLPDV